jgi:hypothetical protein
MQRLRSPNPTEADALIAWLRDYRELAGMPHVKKSFDISRVAAPEISSGPKPRPAQLSQVKAQ